MRTKTVTIGEITYTIGKLSCGQVDEIIFAVFEIKQDRTQITAVVQGSKRAVRERLCPAIAAALNNARQRSAEWFLNGWTNPDVEPVKSSDGATPQQIIDAAWWTGDKVSVEMDYDEMVQLYEAVTALSGLKASVTKGKAKPEGEEMAVAEPALT